MAMAAAEPAVPGPMGDRPQPNQVARMKLGRNRSGFVFNIVSRGIERTGDYVLFAGPIAEVDDAATVATKGQKIAIERNVFFADRTFHQAFSMGKSCGACMKAPASAPSM